MASEYVETTPSNQSSCCIMGMPLMIPSQYTLSPTFSSIKNDTLLLRVESQRYPDIPLINAPPRSSRTLYGDSQRLSLIIGDIFVSGLQVEPKGKQ